MQCRTSQWTSRIQQWGPVMSFKTLISTHSSTRMMEQMPSLLTPASTSKAARLEQNDNEIAAWKFTFRRFSSIFYMALKRYTICAFLVIIGSAPIWDRRCRNYRLSHKRLEGALGLGACSRVCAGSTWRDDDGGRQCSQGNVFSANFLIHGYLVTQSNRTLCLETHLRQWSASHYA